MSEAKLREEICAIGQSIFARGLTAGSSGNISVKIEDGWLMTPTGSSLGRLDPARLSKLGHDGCLVSGSPPTKESFLHRVMYEEQPATGAVVHLHSTHSVAVSCLTEIDPEDVLPPITARFRRKLRDPGLLLVGQVSALVTVPESCYPGSLGELLEGFTCTFLDSLRPRRPENRHDWSSAVRRWRNWPRDTLWDKDAVFDVGPAEIFGVIRLCSSSFAGDVTRAIVCVREPNLIPLVAPDLPSWPRVVYLGDEAEKVP